MGVCIAMLRSNATDTVPKGPPWKPKTSHLAQLFFAVTEHRARYQASHGCSDQGANGAHASAVLAQVFFPTPTMMYEWIKVLRVAGLPCATWIVFVGYLNGR